MKTEEITDSEMFEELNKMKQERHASMYVKNTELLNNSGVEYVVSSRECYLFRQIGKPKVDFYPSTGRWRVVGANKIHKGGSEKFLKWYL